MSANRNMQEEHDLLNEDLLNFDEFPEDLPDLLNLSEEEETAEEESATALSEQEEIYSQEDQIEEEEEEDGEEEEPEQPQPSRPTRMVGLVYKKTAGKAPELQVVEAPVSEPKQAQPEEKAESPEISEAQEEPEENSTAPEEPEATGAQERLPTWENSQYHQQQAETAEEDEEPAEETPREPATWAGLFRRVRAHHRRKQGMPVEEPVEHKPELALVEAPEEEEWGPQVEEAKREPLFRRPPKPDIPPRQLAVLFGNRLDSLKRGITGAAIVWLVLLYLNLSPSLNLPVPAFLWEDGMLAAAMLELLGLMVLLLNRPFGAGFAELFQGMPGMHTLASLAVVLTAADCGVVLLLGREGPAPCAAACGALLLCSSLGQYLKQKGQRISCRTAAMIDHPSRLSLLREDGQVTDMLLKYKGDTSKFGSQIQENDGVQRAALPVCCAILLVGVLLAILSAVGQGEPELVFWCASVIFTLAAPLSSTLAYGLPWCKVAERLNRSGGAVAGWKGAVELQNAAQLAITDDDLIPTGMITCNGIRVYGKTLEPLAVGYAATLVRGLGGSIAATFDKLVFSQGARYWSEGLQNFELFEGGCSGTIGKDRVLVGTGEFMERMDIPLPEQISIKTATFCAINGELAAQFTLVYNNPDYVLSAVQALLRGKYRLVMAVRDFNLNPRMLIRKCNLPMEQITFPELDIRQELAEVPDEADTTLGGLLGREGLDSHCDLVLGAKQLYRVTRKNTRWVIASSVLGAVLGAYLTFFRAYTALQPLNMLVFMTLWLIPCLLNSYQTDQF